MSLVVLSRLVAAAIVVMTAGTATAERRGWTCKTQPIFHHSVKEGIASISTIPTMRNVILDYMIMWDVEEMRKQYASFAAGEPYNISCLNGRRDWNAIKAMVPEDLEHLPIAKHREHRLSIEKERPRWMDAINYCSDLGALSRGN